MKKEKKEVMLNAAGNEIDAEYPDPTPVHIPGLSDQPRPLTLKQEMQRYIQHAVSQAASNNRMETFQEADDFDLEDEEPDILTPYQVKEVTEQPGSYSNMDGEPTSEDPLYGEPPLESPEGDPQRSVAPDRS